MRTLLVVVGLLVAGSAWAQGDVPPQPLPPTTPQAMPAPPPYAAPPTERHGLFGGAGLFGGNISCDGMDCGGFRKAGGANGFVGYMFSPRLGILLDVWAMTSSQDDVSVTFVAGTLNLRYYLLPALWVQGGLGNGHAVVRVSIFEARGDDVPAALLAAGFELARGHSWAIDVSLKVAQGTNTDAGMMANDDVRTGRMVGLGAHFTLFSMR